ncbi:hypothetical protein Lsan_0907 [Legionella santicrucis]|uniref:DUF72 domain-containing protein n=1 Tax=Legionella santicrucis TaxID=45074 RepID=A0A0W0Z712_9GAMM|nr:DUF72 domain-containing protein [Legionella santicrucis]KTD64914.1 hypothetical protein Lsan_0907 [Legionella santicrucis]
MSYVNIGTSEWVYQGWKKIFYPPSLPDKDMLGYYASIFNSVELNNSFYRMPTAKNILKWRENTPEDFIFSCKASRFITHIKKLDEVQDQIHYLFRTLEGLEKKLGPVLFQLPPYWPLDFERLDQFIKELPKSFHITFEFRNKSWLCQRVYDLLLKNNIALCFYDYKGFQCPEIITSDFIYLRLHGPHLQPYSGHYKEESLLNYVHKFKVWNKLVKKIFCYFDNDEKVIAPHDAQLLKKLILLTWNNHEQ